MKMKRLLAGTVSAGMLGLVPLAATAPAHATENHTVTVTATPSHGGVVYGTKIFVSVDTLGSDGRSYPEGTQTLFTMPAGSSTWSPVATTEAGHSFYDVVPRQNSTYKVVYNGHVATTTYENNYAPAESAPFTVKVQRKVTIKKAKARMTIKGKVKPNYKRKPVVVHRKQGKRWVKHTRVRTNRKGAFQVRLPAPRRGKKLYFRITVPGNKKFVKYSEVWYTYTYRAPNARGVVAN